MLGFQVFFKQKFPFFYPKKLVFMQLSSSSTSLQKLSFKAVSYVNDKRTSVSKLYASKLI